MQIFIRLISITGGIKVLMLLIDDTLDTVLTSSDSESFDSGSAGSIDGCPKIKH